MKITVGWGLSPKINTQAVALEHIVIRRWEDGSILGKMPVNKTFGQQAVIHRADLHNALIDKALALKNVEIRLNSTVVDVTFSSPAGGASVTLVNNGDGAEVVVVAGDVVIAADGIKSVIRGRLLGSTTSLLGDGSISSAIPTGDAAYRITLPRSVMEKDPQLKELITQPEATRWIGPGRHIMAYPMRKHELYNVFLAHPDRSPNLEESWTTKGSKQAMLDEYRGWDPRVRKLIDLVADGEVLEWKLCLHSPLKTWVRGSVALLGDACHPML